MEKISKNCVKGDLITKPEDILNLAIKSQSIYCFNWKIKPAAFYLHQKLIVIIRMINAHELYKVINLKKENGITKN